MPSLTDSVTSAGAASANRQSSGVRGSRRARRFAPRVILRVAERQRVRAVADAHRRRQVLREPYHRARVCGLRHHQQPVLSGLGERSCVVSCNGALAASGQPSASSSRASNTRSRPSNSSR